MFLFSISLHAIALVHVRTRLVLTQVPPTVFSNWLRWVANIWLALFPRLQQVGLHCALHAVGCAPTTENILNRPRFNGHKTPFPYRGPASPAKGRILENGLQSGARRFFSIFVPVATLDNFLRNQIGKGKGGVGWSSGIWACWMHAIPLPHSTSRCQGQKLKLEVRSAMQAQGNHQLHKLVSPQIT